ncbi:MAG: CHAT domain-containing protein [Streptomyces sp.]|nr:CHAT domain-containing protein [Streptomyces sp.]
MRDVLAWLWETVADPVLTALGIIAAPDAGTLPPRLHWSPTGPLTLLPLHAAELPETPDASVMARVVSSYVPTLRLTGDAQGAAVPAPRREGHLIVSVPHSSLVPEEPLKGAEAEAAYLVSVLREARPLPVDGVSALAVSAGLGGARGVHFACHGISDAHHPSRSHLVLRDETLTVADLMSHHLDGLGLAFLSACHTAHPGPQLPDEILHLTSAFRVAGARNVVGTLWQAGDQSSALFTKAFYAYLGPLPGAGPSDAETAADRVAAAVYQAAWQVRREWPSPKAWAPFVHVG